MEYGGNQLMILTRTHLDATLREDPDLNSNWSRLEHLATRGASGGDRLVVAS
jgi:hypothetical protein